MFFILGSRSVSVQIMTGPDPGGSKLTDPDPNPDRYRTNMLLDVGC
jgi:hypothetical protein